MYTGACHCGKVKWKANFEPEYLVECNCSLCTKLGALWSHADHKLIDVDYSEKDVNTYIQGDRTLKTIFCKHCGCTTHWEAIDVLQNGRMGLNFRMLINSELLTTFAIKRINGADDSFEVLE